LSVPFTSFSALVGKKIWMRMLTYKASSVVLKTPPSSSTVATIALSRIFFPFINHTASLSGATTHREFDVFSIRWKCCAPFSHPYSFWNFVRMCLARSWTSECNASRICDANFSALCLEYGMGRGPAPKFAIISPQNGC